MVFHGDKTIMAIFRSPTSSLEEAFYAGRGAKCKQQPGLQAAVYIARILFPKS